ncbi:MAG: TRAP transporter small permease subunit, partial [Dehalococcoidia bacterium]|nr:TRAP transporter small permease subunit [Dehalococcoidia bacterium]
MMIDHLKKLNSVLVTGQRWLLGFLMIVLTLAMLAEVVTRYFFGTSLFGLEQHVGYTAVWVYFIGAAYGAYERSHIRAEFTRMIFKSDRKFYISKAASGLV